jgi:hypothetical protein
MEMGKGGRVADFLRQGPNLSVLANAIAEGLEREGRRALEGQHADGAMLGQAFRRAKDLGALLGMAVHLLTPESFLYERVGQCLRGAEVSDRESEHNLGLLIGLLRECFCVKGGLSGVEWKAGRVYRGCKVPIDVIMDMRRRTGQRVFWHGFTSTTAHVNVVLACQPTLVCEVDLRAPTAAPGERSAFGDEGEVILSPYQEFRIVRVEWERSCGCWVAVLESSEEVPMVASWLAGDQGEPQCG